MNVDVLITLEFPRNVVTSFMEVEKFPAAKNVQYVNVHWSYWDHMSVSSTFVNSS